MQASPFPDYPFSPQRFEVRPGIALSYLDEGPRDGEVVVMLHGNPSWSYYWRRLVAGLSDRYRCIVPDHVGMGLSDRPDDAHPLPSVGRSGADGAPLARAPQSARAAGTGGGAERGPLREAKAEPAPAEAGGEGPASREAVASGQEPSYAYTLQSRVDDLDTLLRHLRIDGPVTLAVHDWGGMIGFGWALRDPSRVQRLVITNTAAFPLPAAKTMPWQLTLGRDSRLGGWAIRRFNLFARGAARFGVERSMPRAVRRAYTQVYDGWRDAIATLRFMQDIPLAPGDRAWPLLEQAGQRLPEFADRPAFIGWGLRDFVFDRHFLDGFRDALPNAQVHAFEDAGHYVLEDKHEVLVPAMRAFLDEHPMKTPSPPDGGEGWGGVA